MSKAIFAGGCFWCTEAVFNRLKGVSNVVPGYVGGHIKNPCYREVCMGVTGHAEAIQFEYDEHIISYKTLLEVFFATHDPTTLNRQGNDKGTQYKSAIFYTSVAQKEAAETFINWLTEENIFPNPIVTEVTEASPFYHAEVDHHEYYDLNRSQPYCQYIIDPKVSKLHKHYQYLLKTQ